MLTEQQRLEALVLCDRILESHERAHKNLSEGIAGLIQAIDDIKAKCAVQMPSNAGQLAQGKSN